METIWDHNPTEEELERLAVDPDDEYFRSKADQDVHYMLIVGLIGLRGGAVSDQMAYVDKMQNPSERQTWTMFLNEIGE